MPQVICISGIDTDIGKTVATGLLARSLMALNKTVITQKLVQTGCTGIAEDIVEHRRIMGIPLQAEDKEGLSCKYVFRKPCSPHLAAEREGVTIDPAIITEASRKLAMSYDYVLLEGAGGLQVPINRKVTFLDYVQEQSHALILVSSPRLGSINHTLSALELAKGRGIEVRGIIYNIYGDYDAEIQADSREVFFQALRHHGFPPHVIDMVSLEDHGAGLDTFDCLPLFDQTP
jgi:dethiobiotin synthetase